jgi:hypothetical protein
MIQKALLLLVVLLSTPSFANAYNYWSVTASTSPAISGAITPPSSADYVTSGTTTNVVTSTVTTADFAVNTAPPGYALSYVTIDGVKYTAPNNGATYRVVKGTKITHTLSATYGSQGYTITTSATGNGIIDPTSTVAAGASKSISITASTGYLIASVSAPGATLTGGDGVTRAIYTFTNVQANMTISAVFQAIPTLTARIATSAQGVVVGNPVSIDGGSSSYSGAPTFTWTVTPAGASIAPAADGKTASFVAGQAGNFTVTLTLSAAGTASSSASVALTAITQAASDSNTCITCHSNRNPAFVSDYLGSKHAGTATVSCQRCHNSTGLLSHPYDPIPGGVCAGCHVDYYGSVPLHPIAIGDNPCISCHNPHSLISLVGAPTGHYNNITSAGYPASYMSRRENCLDCHTGTADNAIIRPQWGSSGHASTTAAAFASLDFKYLPGCVQCHSTTGFLAYSTAKVTAAWGVPGDQTKELVTCIACHSDRLLGTIRQVTPATPYADDSFQSHDLSSSNLCTNCHIGTNNGKSIQVKVGKADFSNTPFVAPHFFTSGGTLQGVSGYRFPGRSYASYSTNSHRLIGIGNNAGTGNSGPCATCHMSHLDKHTFKAATLDPIYGNVSAIVSEICVNCHSASLDATQLEASKTEFQNSLAVLQAMLASKGFVYSPNPPFFSNTNWGVGQDGANLMGAAYNYALLFREQGAYTHNAQYAKQLVLDSIDYLDNGTFDDSIGTLAIPQLLAAGLISQNVADSFATYKNQKNLCTTCHGFTASSGLPIASNAHPAHLSTAYGPENYLGPDVNACQACHVFTTTSHRNGVVDLAAGACLGCHAGATPAWSAGRIGCTVCHSSTPAVLPNGVAAPYKANFTSTGHGQFAPSNQCTACHDASSSHISGRLGTYQRLILVNDNNLCASCHNSAVVGIAFRNMSTHVTKDGRALNCRDCHDPHGSANLSMIRSQINGVSIVFTDKINSFVDPASNLGLCQVCHTLTNHYKAGVPESGHFTSGCLNCHTHNSAGGAFRPAGGGACDSCHGYPPVPRNVPVSFGTAGNWAGARYEDYSGGGGAHLVAGHISPNADPSQGWANCAVCHNAGLSGSTPYHTMVTPVASHINSVTVVVDPKLRFSDGFTVYTSARQVNQPSRNATGSCFNISCHMSQSPRWSTER